MASKVKKIMTQPVRDRPHLLDLQTGADSPSLLQPVEHDSHAGIN